MTPCKENQVGSDVGEKLCVRVIDDAFAATEPCNRLLGSKIQVYLSQNGGVPGGSFRKFSVAQSLKYHAFCDDFGPMNMLSVIRFVELLDDQVRACAEVGLTKLVYCAGNGARAFTNAAFLLGAYMLFNLHVDPEQVYERFSGINRASFEEFRDATYSEADFRLSLLDCWRGLHRGMAVGWVAAPTTLGDPFWGLIDKDSYKHYDDPLNADLHEVVPEKFVAFRGPRDLGGRKYRNNHKLHLREFGPEYYVDIFRDMGVSTVVRLNEVQYDEKVFTDNGIEHHDLFFEDCTPPSLAIVRRFFDIVDKAEGLVAVHCKAGLGRTGTLIALYMMRTYGFTAREAMGWLRIMRSGSVIGAQQQFLCRVESIINTIPIFAPPAQIRAGPARPALDSSHGPAGHECGETAGTTRAEGGVGAGSASHDAAGLSNADRPPSCRGITAAARPNGGANNHRDILAAAAWPCLGEGDHAVAARLAAQVAAAVRVRSGPAIVVALTDPAAADRVRAPVPDGSC